jgi:hypothetical protein
MHGLTAVIARIYDQTEAFFQSFLFGQGSGGLK